MRGFSNSLDHILLFQQSLQYNSPTFLYNQHITELFGLLATLRTILRILGQVFSTELRLR